MTQNDATRLIQIPIPRPSAGSTESGIEMTRISTKTEESAPRARMTRLSGAEAGSPMPASRKAMIATTAKPMKKTSLPSTPVCQPITASLTPTPEPAYQPMNDERASTSPDTHVTGSPAAQSPSGAPRTGLGGGTGSGSAGSAKRSGVSTGLSMGNKSVRGGFD